MTIQTLTNLDFALNYASEWGWAVMPLHSIENGKCTCGKVDCSSPGKHPRTVNGSKDASKDFDQIEAWFKQWPEANIGIATGPSSGIVVLDVDLAKGAHTQSLIFGDVDLTIFTTPKVKTGAGLHFYYRYPAGIDIKNSASKLGPFIDVRGDGGYVVAPPSAHSSGKKYEFLNAISELAEFPQDWIDKLQLPPAPAPSVNGTAPGSVSGPQGPGSFVIPPPPPGIVMPDSISQGSRNQTLTSIAGKLRHGGLSEGAIYAALNIENQRVCTPPLGDDEIRHIAFSVGRYAPQDPIDPVSDPADPNAPPDHENTLRPYLFRDFMAQTFEEKEILGFHIGKRDIAIIQAATNAGKTTLLRNIGMCMAAGRPFEPFYEGSRPIKIAYFDFENDAQDVQRDLRQMFGVFTADEVRELEQNYIVIPKGLMGGELFQFNTHEKWANELIEKNAVEFIIVDNVSAAYDLNDENSNAEVTKKVIKPLLKMAYTGNCAFLFAHHYGKKKNELEHAGVHAGRGASALQALSRTVINMFGDVSKGEPVTVECAKRKTDGGQNYTRVFKLEADRWFHLTNYVQAPKVTAYKKIRQHMVTVQYPATVTKADLITLFESDFKEDSIKKAVDELFRDGFIEKPQHGRYCGAKPKDPDDPAPADIPPARNYVDTDAKDD